MLFYKTWYIIEWDILLNKKLYIKRNPYPFEIIQNTAYVQKHVCLFWYYYLAKLYYWKYRSNKMKGEERKSK